MTYYRITSIVKVPVAMCYVLHTVNYYTPSSNKRTYRSYNSETVMYMPLSTYIHTCGTWEH